MEPSLSSRYQMSPVLEELRRAHTGLIQEGLESLSQGYMDQFAEEAEALGVKARLCTLEGRNYVKILEQVESCGAGLVMLGAHGLGRTGDGRLGSTASRVLRQAGCDVFICRGPFETGSRILVGLDGSREALGSLERAAAWCRALGARLELAAAYDPVFHTEVFKVMSRSLSDDRKVQIGLDRQEKLHHMIIDDGLKRLYEGFLEEGAALAQSLGVANTSILLQGKAYSTLIEYMASGPAPTLAVVGRFGHHREPCSDIGSNSESIAGRSPCNVLVTKAVDTPSVQARLRPSSLEWEAEAESRLQRVPSFVRHMARRMVEEQAQRLGMTRISADFFTDTANRMGMGRRPDGSDS